MFSWFKKIKKDRRGVSLMEMVVAVAVFSVVIMMAMDLYFIAQKAQRKTTAIQRVQSDARYSLEAISREIRVGRIDYSSLPDDLSGPVDALTLLDEDGCRVSFQKSTNNAVCQQGLVNSCLAVQVEQVDGEHPCDVIALTGLTPKTIIVDTLDFYISPISDPFTQNSEINEQPRVTIVFASQNVANRPEDQRSLIIQTTVSSRFYGR